MTGGVTSSYTTAIGTKGQQEDKVRAVVPGEFSKKHLILCFRVMYSPPSEYGSSFTTKRSRKMSYYNQIKIRDEKLKRFSKGHSVDKHALDDPLQRGNNNRPQWVHEKVELDKKLRRKSQNKIENDVSRSEAPGEQGRDEDDLLIDNLKRTLSTLQTPQHHASEGEVALHLTRIIDTKRSKPEQSWPTHHLPTAGGNNSPWNRQRHKSELTFAHKKHPKPKALIKSLARRRKCNIVQDLGANERERYVQLVSSARQRENGNISGIESFVKTSTSGAEHAPREVFAEEAARQSRKEWYNDALRGQFLKSS